MVTGGPLQLPKESDSPDNLLSVELFTKSPLLLDHMSVLGRASLHLHDIIHVSHHLVPLAYN